MSYFVTEAVILTEGIPYMQKVVLIALAQHADHDGSGARPGLDRIAKLAGMGKSTAAKWLAWLETERYIVPEDHDGGGRDSNGRGMAVEYRVVTERLQYVKGLQYKDGVNLLQDRTFDTENLLQDRTFKDEKVLRGESNLLRGESNLLQYGPNLLPRRPQSVRESVSESVNNPSSQDLAIGSGDLGEGLAPSSFASQGEEDTEEEAIAAIRVVLVKHCRRISGNDNTRKYYYDDFARKLRQEKGATASEAARRAMGCTPRIVASNLYYRWEELAPKQAPAISPISDATSPNEPRSLYALPAPAPRSNDQLLSNFSAEEREILMRQHQRNQEIRQAGQ